MFSGERLRKNHQKSAGLFEGSTKFLRTQFLQSLFRFSFFQVILSMEI